MLHCLAVLAGGVAELSRRSWYAGGAAHGATRRPYTALELEGRDIYVREGCYVCHSQMIRSLRGHDALRRPSTPEEFIYDHPFQWGSKRTGPDLAREGGKYPNLWHYRHLMDPRSIQPRLEHAAATRGWRARRVDVQLARAKLALMQKLGVPYTNDQIDGAEAPSAGRPMPW